MATADKLTTVAENVPKVYHAGQLNVVENAECLKANKSGSAILIDDVSPVSHEMGVKVRGKNLFDINSSEFIDASIVDSGVQFTGKSGGTFDILLPAGTYTISFKRNKNATLYLRNGKVASGYISVINSTETSKKFTFNADIDGYLRVSAFANDLILSDIQIELGTTATDYTPYIPDLTAVKVIKLNGSDETVAEYTPTADGIVEGVTSLYPNTTLMTDTEGVIIDCDYYKDVDKAFDELTQAMTDNL